MTSTSRMKPDFKFIHLADTHLGLNWPAIGRRESIQISAYGKAFELIIDAAIERQVDFVIHAGDLVNRPHPPTAAWSRILLELPRLKQAGIPFIITVGSHDKSESYFDKAGGDVLQLLESRLSLARRVDTDQTPAVNIETRQGKRISVYGLGDHGREQEETLQELRKHMSGDADFSILLMHGTVSEMPRMVGPTVDTKTIGDLLSQRYVDYVALGHNHRRWEHKDLQIFNPGSPEVISFADAPTITYSYDGTKLTEEQREPIEHGYYLVEVTGEIINAQFQTLPTRDVRNIQVRFDDATAPGVVEGAKMAISQNISNSGIIRPVLKGTLHPSTSRTDINVPEIMSLREKLLFLDYPLLDFNMPQVQLEIAEGSDIAQPLNQYFKSTLAQNAEKATRIATKLIELYARKTKTTHQEALSEIDGWQPDD
ncbi:MAG: metallophosphoesterase [Candidatus Bathyarchaeia archaeon]